MGHLFQDRYKAIVCDRDEYLATLIRDIHLNPVRALTVPGLGPPRAHPWHGVSPWGIVGVTGCQLVRGAPPFGGACFFPKGVAPPDVTMEEIFACAGPGWASSSPGSPLVMAFPELALWLLRVAR